MPASSLICLSDTNKHTVLLRFCEIASLHLSLYLSPSHTHTHTRFLISGDLRRGLAPSKAISSKSPKGSPWSYTGNSSLAMQNSHTRRCCVPALKGKPCQHTPVTQGLSALNGIFAPAFSRSTAVVCPAVCVCVWV